MANIDSESRRLELATQARALKAAESHRASVSRYSAWLLRELQMGKPGKRFLEVMIEQDGFVKEHDVTVRPDPLG